MCVLNTHLPKKMCLTKQPTNIYYLTQKKKKIHRLTATKINVVTVYPNTSLLRSIKMKIILIMNPNKAVILMQYVRL